MSNVPQLLAASLDPVQRKAAEAELEQMSAHAGFLPHVLQIILETSQPLQVRQSACLYFKNQVKRRWDDEDEPPVPDADKTVIRDHLVASMVQLSSPADRLLRTQVGEAVAVIAKTDFPHPWENLIPSLVSSLTPNDYNINIAVLQTAHNIFSRWRSEIRSNELFTTILKALEQFQEAFFALFRATATHLLTTATQTGNVAAALLLGDTMDLLVSLYHDLTAQDLPPAFEDSIGEFFGSETEEGWFLRFLQWDPSQLSGDPDDPNPTAPIRIRTSILEICELFALQYNDVAGARVPTFVRAVWELIGRSGETVREDGLVSQAIRFLSVTVKTGWHTDLFRQRETLQGILERIIVPNMILREHELEQFEDDPLEYIRRDLSLGSEGGPGATRRQASAELLRALISVRLEQEVTEIAQTYIAAGLQRYNANTKGNWKDKDTALYLFTSIAALASTVSHGVTSVNPLVDVVQFFSEHVYSDLQAAPGTIHEILPVDAIRFIYTFRYQLTKDQLLIVLPLLVGHLGSDNYVSYSYAAVTIERVLFIKRNNLMLFAQADIHESARPILTALFAKIRGGDTPQKIAENDYLMKCAMRVIVTARQTLSPIYQDVLNNLVAILAEISKNPSNPNFNQYCFESISALIRFVVAGNASTLGSFENVLLGPFTAILQQDVDQFVPYVLQILAQLLELHTTSAPPPTYGTLLPLLVTPVVWQQKGSIPALVRLIKAYLAKDAANIVRAGQLNSILAVVQQRLIPSKTNDVYGFEMLEAVVMHVPSADLTKVFNAVMVTLLTRMQQGRTDRYASAFVRFLSFAMAVQGEGLGPNFVVGSVESIQPGLWTSVITNIVLPQIPKFQPRDRKLVAVGLARLLTQSPTMLAEPASAAWAPTMTALLNLLASADGISKTADEEVTDDLLSSIDHEEASAGYQASFSRLAASEPAKLDPVAYVPDVKAYLKTEMTRLAASDPRVNAFLQGVPQDLIGRVLA